MSTQANKSTQITDTKPWYRYGWPWALMLGPAAVIAASAATIYIAFLNAPTIANPEIGRFAQVQSQSRSEVPQNSSAANKASDKQ